jgi:hypothetical protein
MPLENLDLLPTINAPFGASASPSLGNMGQDPGHLVAITQGLGQDPGHLVAITQGLGQKLPRGVFRKRYEAAKSAYIQRMHGKRVPRFPSFNEWMVAKDPKVMDKQIGKLPMLLQIQLGQEINAAPGMAKHIQMLLAQPDPVVAIYKDREKAAIEVTRPGTFPKYQGLWPYFRARFKVAWGKVIRGVARKMSPAQIRAAALPKGLRGFADDWMEREGKYDEVQIYGIGRWGRKDEYPVMDGMGDLGDFWGDLAKTAMQLVKDEGIPAIKKELELAKKRKEDKRRERAERAAAAKAEETIVKAAEEITKPEVVEKAEEEINKLVDSAMRNEADVSNRAAPDTNAKPKGLGTGAKIGIGVGATAVALALGAVIWKVTRK